MPRLSLAMIVKNEQDVIGRCLNSVKDIVDEIVVIDTGSTDRTVEIAKRYTHRIYRFKWIDDFSAARNYSFQQCTGDFILWLDADDIIKPVDAEKIKNLDLSDKELIICPYIYHHDEFDNPSLTVPRERIIKRSLGLKWQQPIHEHIRLSSAKQYISNIEIHHYRKGGTSKRNLSILERIVKGDNAEPGFVSDGVDPRNIYYLGKEYHDVSRFDEAIAYFEKYVDLSDGRFRFWEDVYQAYYRLAQCYQHKKDDNNFKRCFFESIKIEDRRAEPYCLMGEWYISRQDWVRGMQWYKMALCVRRPENLLSSYRPLYYTWLPCLQIAVCAYNLKDYEQAKEYNEKFARYRPDDSRASFNRRLIELVLQESVTTVKKLSSPKIGWICANTEREHNAAQTRLRVINLNRWLQSKGYQSELVSYSQIIDDNYDIAIVGKGFDENNLNWIKKLKEKGKTVYCDLCEHLIGWPYVNEILTLCDKVICCSRLLAEDVKPINPTVEVIEEARES